MRISNLWAIASIVTVAVATPGPNNFIIMSAAARDGVRGARRLIGSVIAVETIPGGILAGAYGPKSQVVGTATESQIVLIYASLVSDC